MAPPRTPKIIAGTVAAAVTLTAGAAIASELTAPAEPALDDVVLVRDVEPPEWSAADLVAPDDTDSVASPFDSVSAESVESVESVESISVESVESVSVESIESVSIESVSMDSESVESVSMESLESVSMESVSMESVSAESPDSVDSP